MSKGATYYDRGVRGGAGGRSPLASSRAPSVMSLPFSYTIGAGGSEGSGGGSGVIAPVHTRQAASHGGEECSSKGCGGGSGELAQQQAAPIRILFALWSLEATSARVEGNFCATGIDMAKDEGGIFVCEAVLAPNFSGDVSYQYFCDGKLQEAAPLSMHCTGAGNILTAAQLTAPGTLAAGAVAALVLKERAEAAERHCALQDVHAAVDAWGGALAVRFKAAQVAHLNEKVTRAFAPAHNAANLACNYMLDAINICARVHGATPPCEDV